MSVRWAITTPAERRGAIACIHLAADEREALDRALERVAGGAVAAGGVVLRDIAGVDRGLVARWGATEADLFCHGGPAVLRRLAAALESTGFSRDDEPDVLSLYPEAHDVLEARMLHALARAASPLALDLLLDQPRRWHERGDHDRGLDAALDRLIRPPLVVFTGPTNVGKSTLVNALAGRRVSVVSPEPGTTRDHVGVAIDCGGLVVRAADLPGARGEAAPIEVEAFAAAESLLAAADLIVSCGDAGSPPRDDLADRPTLVLALRTDLGRVVWPHDLAVCVVQGSGLDRLASGVRDRLVPPAALGDPRPWRFWVPTDPTRAPG